MSPIARTLVLLLLLAPSAVTRAAASHSLSESLKAAESAAKAGKWKDAAQHWTRVVDDNPVNADYWEQLALARYRAKEYKEAVPAFEKALELRAGYPFHQAYNIACCQALLGQKESAINWLQKSMDLGLRDLNHAREDSDLASLRNDPRFKEMFAVVDTSGMSRDEGYRYDIRLLNRELKRVHFNLRRGIRAGELDAETARLLESVPSLSEEQIMVAMMRLVRIADDGHTSLGPARGASIPLRLFQFKEGLFVAAAGKDHRDLVGAQILKIEGESAEK